MLLLMYRSHHYCNNNFKINRKIISAEHFSIQLNVIFSVQISLTRVVVTDMFDLHLYSSLTSVSVVHSQLVLLFVEKNIILNTNNSTKQQC